MKNKKKRSKLLIILILLIVLAPIFDVFTKATLSKANIEVERLRKQVLVQERKNQSIAMKVNELKSFDSIQQAVSSLGLAYNSNNVKVVNR